MRYQIQLKSTNYYVHYFLPYYQEYYDLHALHMDEDNKLHHNNVGDIDKYHHITKLFHVYMDIAVEIHSIKINELLKKA